MNYALIDSEIARNEARMSALDNRRFMKMANSDGGVTEEFRNIDCAVLSNDKYPRLVVEYGDFDEVRLSRNKDKKFDQNIVRLFTGPKKKQVLVGQYSYKWNFLPSFNELKDYDIDIFHHTDMDGDASASIIYNFIKINKITNSVFTYRYNYNGKTLNDLVTRAIIREKKTNKKNACFIVDLSITELDLVKILDSYDTVVMIDHHQTSLTMINDIYNKELTTKKFSYAIDTRCCATFLTLALLKYHVDKMDNEEYYIHPEDGIGYKIASLINVYDLKLDKKYPDAYEIATYMNQYYFDYKHMYSFSNIWQDAFYDPIYEINVLDKIFDAGKKLAELERTKMRILYENGFVYTYTINLFENKNEYPYKPDRIRFKAIYGTGNSSRFIKDSNDGIPEIDFLIRFRGDELILVISAYTDDDVLGEVDLSKFFSKYSMGGGHKKACGGSIYTDDIYELLTSLGDNIDSHKWAFGNDSAFNYFSENRPKKKDKTIYHNWKMKDLKDYILKNKHLFEFYTGQTNLQNTYIRKNYAVSSINPALDYEIETIVEFLVRIYSVIIYNYLTHSNLQ